LPIGDANVPIVCVTCHNPHEVTSNPAQLRNPIVSTNNYFLSTSENFAAKYDENINICAQCHNHRGASWTSTSRAPHHSPQYNFLLGTVGELKAGATPYRPRHATLEKQCVSCHMQSEEYISPAQPRVTGHTFRVDNFDVCRSCHSLPELLADFTAMATDWRVQQVKSALDLWATTKAPAALRDKYGVRAWEYTIPGELTPSGSGPTTAEQASIPDNIKKARFNMYIVISDGSGGAHNGPYSVKLLDTAREWVEEELNK
jgi:formate-dependent nitrite reductase cytochrome c552 subunit